MQMMAGLLAAALMAGTVLANEKISDRARTRIEREVRHEVLSQPYFDVFDNVAFRVDGYKVTLIGQVTRPTLKTNIEKAVKDIEGVEAVDNRIEVLPVSPADDRLRMDLYQAIYGATSLQRYALSSIRPIRIIVKNGNVTLEGTVNNQADKTVAGLQAQGVTGVFSVTNNLQVAGGEGTGAGRG